MSKLKIHFFTFLHLHFYAHYFRSNTHWPRARDCVVLRKPCRALIMFLLITRVRYHQSSEITEVSASASEKNDILSGRHFMSCYRHSSSLLFSGTDKRRAKRKRISFAPQKRSILEASTFKKGRLPFAPFTWGFTAYSMNGGILRSFVLFPKNTINILRPRRTTAKKVYLRARRPTWLC